MKKIELTPMFIIIIGSIILGIIFPIDFTLNSKISKKDQDLYLESLTRSNFYLDRQLKFIDEENLFMINYYDSLLNIEKEKRYVLDSIKAFE